MHTYRVTNATFVQTHYFIFLFPIFVNICDIAIIGNVYVLLCLKKLLQWAARWPPFIILTGQQVMEAAPAKYIFMRHPFNRKNIWLRQILSSLSSAILFFHLLSQMPFSFYFFNLFLLHGPKYFLLQNIFLFSFSFPPQKIKTSLHFQIWDSLFCLWKLILNDSLVAHIHSAYLVPIIDTSCQVISHSHSLDPISVMTLKLQTTIKDHFLER